MAHKVWHRLCSFGLSMNVGQKEFMKSIAPVLALLIVGFQASASDWSVWQAAKKSQYEVEGKIRAIVSNEDEQQILVRVESSTKPTRVETLKVCTHDNGSDYRNWQQSEKMALLRQAFQRGDRVGLSYGGPFDRCLSGIRYEIPSKSDTKGLPGGSI